MPLCPPPETNITPTGPSSRREELAEERARAAGREAAKQRAREPALAVDRNPTATRRALVSALAAFASGAIVWAVLYFALIDRLGMESTMAAGALGATVLLVAAFLVAGEKRKGGVTPERLRNALLVCAAGVVTSLLILALARSS